MHGIKIPQKDFALKGKGGLCARGRAYLWDTTVLQSTNRHWKFLVVITSNVSDVSDSKVIACGCKSTSH